jgi:hypothetical protein
MIGRRLQQPQIMVAITFMAAGAEALLGPLLGALLLPVSCPQNPMCLFILSICASGSGISSTRSVLVTWIDVSMENGNSLP